MTDELLDHELTIVERIHQDEELSKPISIVTPRHQQPNDKVLKDHNISVIRTPYPEYYSSPNWIDMLGKVGG
ncbi:MAG: hypothetical protein ABEI86_09840, partial [Halobacteriaceae archaeon]